MFLVIAVDFSSSLLFFPSDHIPLRNVKFELRVKHLEIKRMHISYVYGNARNMNNYQLNPNQPILFVIVIRIPPNTHILI